MSTRAPQTLMLLLIAAVGCGEPELRTRHGVRSGANEGSVNGLSVLSRMFESAGADVRSWSWLSPSLGETDVIVWAPDDFNAPSPEAHGWIYSWLTGEPGRTLIYIGRDFDATPGYWAEAEKLAAAPLAPEYARRRREATARQNTAAGKALSPDVAPGWFTLDPAPKPAKVTRFTGRWGRTADASKAGVERRTRLIPVDPSAVGPDNRLLVLLGDQSGEPIVSQLQYATYADEPSRLIMIENGSWLLNEPLVNHEHRKLAGQLVRHVRANGREVVVLESGPGGPPVRNEDPSGAPPMGLLLFRVWPIGATLAQIAVLGVVFALSRWPIFGVPRRLEQDSLTDFGRHTDAVGRLLAATKDRAFAYGRLLAYRDKSTSRDAKSRT
ncbi:hypothetical protein Pla175_50080 [Pirellulimonas nuda]|uniref:DUF4350 domain-containing protein n=1 Tax=Pirellulimonas nuda TaxID=2528009 RepID=A0A518DJD9_9BACT|nr:hypothetical protein [Pirellulimonas nuda]QDU91578.1 hypothetical protein Pla175_50080 [Pirellulimonas nuda]